jgi:hypothetical protein
MDGLPTTCDGSTVNDIYKKVEPIIIPRSHSSFLRFAWVSLKLLKIFLGVSRKLYFPVSSLVSCGFLISCSFTVL